MGAGDEHRDLEVGREDMIGVCTVAGLAWMYRSGSLGGKKLDGHDVKVETCSTTKSNLFEL